MELWIIHNGLDRRSEQVETYLCGGLVGKSGSYSKIVLEYLKLRFFNFCCPRFFKPNIRTFL